jgi:hypothetical protein
MQSKINLTDDREDHRVRVGAQRRNKTRLKLLESALEVLNAKGPDAAFTTISIPPASFCLHWLPK